MIKTLILTLVLVGTCPQVEKSVLVEKPPDKIWSWTVSTKDKVWRECKSWTHYGNENKWIECRTKDNKRVLIYNQPVIIEEE